ncbi:hypothetical protein [Pseudohoeflea coraliihabitans]|uniref:Tail tubular protein A n=1 Tax=Pseudohoeflea coraliihabitans TaxID=2860393 RepID=A0ABS6WTD6_9HYPH|nr:hypothetical protein [Pseudohoeflea sp. DP4N28-3]MBW3099229.1 hypothetical protein [Pseudohoeflea sp. DP4N28-3]
MSTLATLKAEIADDMDRDDLTSAIASEINRAIRFYQSRHFYFNETRDATFTTVASQVWYSEDDDADISQFVDIDFVHITVGSNRYQLRQKDIKQFELLTDGNASNGQPYCYTYYNRSIGLFVPPDAAYTVRVLGSYMTAAPATDDEADNVWMTEAFDLIRWRAQSRLYAGKLKDLTTAATCNAMEADELGRIERETAVRHKTNRVKAVTF